MGDFKDFLNDLTRDELLVFTYVSFPKFTTESGIKDEIYSKRKPSAVSPNCTIESKSLASWINIRFFNFS